MSHPGRLRHRVGRFIAEEALWAPGHRVAVAVSGGRDSVVLLDLLVATARWHQGVLSVVHVDHGARPGSAEDARFVEALAASHGLPCRTEVVAAAADEASLRQARYGAFERLDVERVAMAHHRRDQAETVLLRLVQGAGRGGLTGMRARRGRYVRPLLEVPHADLARWAELRHLEHREDPTNASPRYLRNRVRSEVLPLLEDLRPGATAVIARAAGLLAADEAFMATELTARGLAPVGPWPISAVQGLPDPLLRRFLLSRGPDVGKGPLDELARLVRRGYGATLVTSGWTWQVVEGWLEVRPPAGSGR